MNVAINTYNTCFSLARMRSSLVLIGVCAIGVAGCAPTATGPASPAVASDVAPQVRTVGAILKADPRFADFVRVIDFAGLDHKLNDDHNVTVFAPTNAAFQHAEPNWRATEIPDASSNGWSRKRQNLVEQSFLEGVHRPSQFAGVTQDVRTRNGSVFHVDGRQPGVLSITIGSNKSLMGHVRRTERTAKAELPPIEARDGIIYPVDNILVR